MIRSLLVIGLCLISSCGNNDKTEDSPYLEKDYEYIVGILVPDSFCAYRHEIFVGKMLDIRVPSSEVDTTHYGEDPMLYTQNLVTWHFYRGKIAGNTGAVVEISDLTDNKTVSFLSIGNGIYQDVNNQLEVKALHVYRLNVSKDGNTFHAQTTVPGDFEVSNINEGDTVAAVGVRQSYFYLADYPPHWTSSQGKFFYRTDHKIFKYSSPIINHVYNPPGFFTVTLDTVNYILPFTSNGWIQVTALDTSYGRMYSPEATSTAPVDLLTYISNQETTPLPERTNIQGNEVVGVFGSVNRTKRINFYMRVVKED